MDTLNLAAASLGAAAPVPPAQDAPPNTAPGFADVLAGFTDGGNHADAAGSSAARHAGGAKGQPAWVALEQLVRQLALSSGLPVSVVAEPRAAERSVQDIADERVAPKADGEGPPPSAPYSSAVPAPVVPAALGGLSVAPAIAEQADLATIESRVHEAERAVTEPVAAGSDAAMVTANHRPRADAADDADVNAVPEAAVLETDGLALEASEAIASAKAPTPPSRANRAGVETFREWAASVARAQAPVTDGVATSPAAAPATPSQQQPMGVATGFAQAVDPGQALSADPTSAIGQRGPRGVRRTPEAARVFVDRFKANEASIEATLPNGRAGGRPVDAGTTPSGDKPPVAAAPPPRFDLPALSGATAGLRNATPISSEAPTLVDQDGGLESQIVQAVKVQWGRDGGEARIRLQPHYLGELMISLRVDQGGVTAHLVASAPEVRQWIESNEAMLRQSLAQHDLTLERLVVTEEEPSAGTSEEGPRHKESREQARRQPRRSHREATFEVVV